MAGLHTRVVERFPQHAGLIERLARRSEDFRTLCEDYTLVVETLADLMSRRPPASETIIREYRSCLLDIELDIADALVTAIGREPS